MSEVKKAPVNIPPELYSEFTNGYPLFYWYMDNAGASAANITWPNEYIQDYVNRFTYENINNNSSGQEPYINGALFVKTACEKYQSYIYNKHVAVIGSETPWIEAILLNSGAKSITTVEYNVPHCDHGIIKSISYDTFTTQKDLYDCVVSYSSIEHSGLGRYGDPLEPNGDIITMKHIHSSLKMDSILLLGIPVGHDALVWNVHRIYGKQRLAKLFQGFKEIEWFGDTREEMEKRQPHWDALQPIIALKPLW